MANILDKIKMVEAKYYRKDLPEFKVGDTIKMKIRVQEADKSRLHPFEGIIIRKTGGGLTATFTVRKVSFGEGVEKTFPVHSPIIDSINVVSKGKTNRSRLFYLRERTGHRAKIKQQEEKVQAVPQSAA